MKAQIQKRLDSIETAVNVAGTPPAMCVTCSRNDDGLYSVDGEAPFYTTMAEVVAAIERERGIRVCGTVCLATPPPLPDEDREEAPT